MAPPSSDSGAVYRFVKIYSLMPIFSRGRALPAPTEVKWRHRFSVLASATTVLLLGWGAFVTSINAGLAVPDWPSSFNSYDPFNPWPEWWKLTPVLAEHGHRLLGALVGLFTLALAVWTWIAEPRRWMRWLALRALVLVSVQGELGGLRVVLISLDLAVVHACVALIFFVTIVGTSIFTFRSWLEPDFGSFNTEKLPALRRIAVLTIALLYLQIILGALLRHPGTGIDVTLVLLHLGGAIAVTTAIIILYAHVRRFHGGAQIAAPAARLLVGLVAVQFALGLTAYFVTLDDAGVLQPSNLQVVVNTIHMVTGALLMGSATAALLGAVHLSRADRQVSERFDEEAFEM